MLKATEFLESLSELKKQYTKPVSNIYALNDLMYYRNSQPPVFTDNQREFFISNIDKLSEFLSSDEGAIAVELLVDAFSCFIESQNQDIEECEIEEADETKEEEIYIDLSIK